MSDLYPEEILDAFKFPQHKRKMNKPDQTIDGSNSSCGDDVIFYLKGKAPFTDISWEGDGCAVSQAAIDLLVDKITEEKLSPAEILKLTQADMQKLLGLEQVSPGRQKCVMMGLVTLQKALQAKK